MNSLVFPFLYIFLFNRIWCQTTNSPSTIHFIRPKRENHATKHSHLQGPLIKGSLAYVCVSAEKCQKIEEFHIAENYTYNCFESYLPINYFTHDEKKNTRFGYLTTNGMEIVDTQKYTEECRKIRRFEINQIHLLISIGENMVYAERKKADSIIEHDLFSNFHLITWLCFKLKLYDEESDDLLYFKSIKDLTFYFFCLKYILFIFLTLKDVYFVYCEHLESREKKKTDNEKSIKKKGF